MELCGDQGSIESGKLAEFVVLEEDILVADPFSIKDIKVLKTVVGGKSSYEI